MCAVKCFCEFSHVKIDIIINVSMAVSSPVSGIDVMSDMAAEYGLSCQYRPLGEWWVKSSCKSSQFMVLIQDIVTCCLLLVIRGWFLQSSLFFKHIGDWIMYPC
jgi:hypothetical protein